MLEASEEFEQLRKKRRQESPWAQKPIYVKGPGWASSWSLSDPWGHVGNKGASQGLVLAGAEQCRLGVTCSAAASRVEKKGLSYASLGALWLRRTKGWGAVPEHPQRVLSISPHYDKSQSCRPTPTAFPAPGSPGSCPLSSPQTQRADHQAGTRQGLAEKRAGNGGLRKRGASEPPEQMEASRVTKGGVRVPDAHAKQREEAQLNTETCLQRGSPTHFSNTDAERKSYQKAELGFALGGFKYQV